MGFLLVNTELFVKEIYVFFLLNSGLDNNDLSKSNSNEKIMRGGGGSVSSKVKSSTSPGTISY